MRMTEAEYQAALARLAAGKRAAAEPVPVPAPTVFSVQPTTDEARLNKTERGWLAVLRPDPQTVWVGIQNMTLKLADDTRYTPDFFSLNREGRLFAWEVKGFFRDDAKVKIKVAARAFPWIRFVLVRREKGGAWKTEDVNP